MNLITKLAYNALTKTIQAILPGGSSVTIPANAGDYRENVRGSASPNLTANVMCSIDSGNVTFNDNNETGITLGPGEWDIQGAVRFDGGAGCSAVDLTATIGTAKGSSNTGASDHLNTSRYLIAFSTPVRANMITPIYRVSITTPTTYYLKALANFSGGTLSATGIIRARQVRG